MNYTNQSKLRIKSHEGNKVEIKKNPSLFIIAFLASIRPKRKRITPNQLEVLTSIFERTKTPNYQLREHTAKELNMTNREVQVSDEKE